MSRLTNINAFCSHTAYHSAILEFTRDAVTRARLWAQA
jgi:hypothetical protein